MIERERVKSNEYSKDFERIRPRLIQLKHLQAKLNILKEARTLQEFHLKRETDIKINLGKQEESIRERERLILALENQLKLIIPKAKKIG